MDLYQKYIHLSRYARFKDSSKRRETWPETVTRYCDFWREKYPDLFPYEDMHYAILNMDIMPSMRALMTAGEALDRDNIAGYNCAYLPISNERAFDTAMYILLCGTGVGFSVERQYIQHLPSVAEDMFESDTTIVVQDSKLGWASSLKELIALLYAGKIPKWDLSRIRPKGSRLKVFGGRASGPEPLDSLFRNAVEIFNNARGRKLSSVECHDLVCHIASAVVVGGVRRSALLSLSNLTDERIRTSKVGSFWETNPQRGIANNSVAYTETPDTGIFMKEWLSLYESQTGERGIFNRVSAKKQAAATGRRDASFEFGTNPCGEIILRPNGLCNLTEVVIRDEDSIHQIGRKVELATILGTFQSTLTNFRYLPAIWKKNAEEERLLGVSFTGIMDHSFFSTPSEELNEVLTDLKEGAIKVNKHWAEKLGINPSSSITTVKPSGTVSQLVNSASGIHARHSPYYLRTVRGDNKDPLAAFLKGQGVYSEPDITNPSYTDVFYFPIKSPEHAVFRNDRTALEQLDLYMAYKKYWCEHNPSITVYIKEQEWMEVGAWVKKNFDSIGGISFLPFSEHVYKQAPYQDITKEQYEEWLTKTPLIINFEEFTEDNDATTASQELACLAGSCEI